MTTTSETQIIEEWKNNVEFFNLHKNEIRWKYGNRRYVVIKNERIIDSGLDAVNLNDKYSGQNVLIASCFDTINDYLESPLADSPNEYN